MGRRVLIRGHQSTGTPDFTERKKTIMMFNRLVYVSCGKDDFLYEKNVAMKQALTDQGIAIAWVEQTGKHEWRLWRGPGGFCPQTVHQAKPQGKWKK